MKDILDAINGLLAVLSALVLAFMGVIFGIAAFIFVFGGGVLLAVAALSWLFDLLFPSFQWFWQT